MNKTKIFYTGVSIMLCTAASGMHQHLCERQHSPAAEKYKHLSIKTPDELLRQTLSERTRIVRPNPGSNAEIITRLSLIQETHPMPVADEIYAATPFENLDLVNMTKAMPSATAHKKNCPQWLTTALVPCVSFIAVLVLMHLAIKRS